MPRPRPSLTSRNRPLWPWLVRRVEAVRGTVRTRLELFPAFNYARDSHTTEIDQDGKRATFKSKDLTLELLAIVVPSPSQDVGPVAVKLSQDDDIHGKDGPGVIAEMDLEEGQVVTFVLREPVLEKEAEGNTVLTDPDHILTDT